MLIRSSWLAAAMAVLVLLAAGSTRATPGASAQGDTQGDVTCDSSVNAVDSLQILRDVAGLGTTAGCLASAGDVNCDTAVNSVDALRILRYVAGLSVVAPDGCAPIGDPLGPPTPQVLAARLHAAPDAGHAEALLRLVYHELDVGLYTGNGHQIQAGAETGPDDFYLYDFESDLLARNYAERQMYGLDTAVVFLGEAGVVDEDTGQPFTDAGLLPVLAAKVAASRTDETQFAWRLIDALGLAREDPLDLTTPGLGPADIYLDSVQMFVVLYDMTLGQPAAAGASALGISAAAAPGARAKALHDYSLLAQAYNLTMLPVDPTHWRHGGQDSDRNRRVDVYVSFSDMGGIMQGITAGPLQGVALPPDGGVPGAVLDWFPDVTLRSNGHMEHRPESRITDADGSAYDNFLVNTECPGKAGVGQSVDEFGKIQVVARIEVTSVFPPHSHMGMITKQRGTTIKVSHHTGTAAQLNAAAVSSEGITSLDDLPCQWTGTAHAHHTQDDVHSSNLTEVGEIDATFTFGNPVRQPGGNQVKYEITSGSATWLVSFGCDIHENLSRSGTEEVSGELIVTDNGSGSLTYTGLGVTVGQDTTVPCGVLETSTFFNTCGDEQPLSGLDLSDHCTIPDPTFSDVQRDDKYEWHLTAVSCTAAAMPAAAVAPEGLCGP